MKIRLQRANDVFFGYENRQPLIAQYQGYTLGFLNLVHQHFPRNYHLKTESNGKEPFFNSSETFSCNHLSDEKVNSVLYWH